MAGTAEMLRSTLGENGYAVFLTVAGHAEPVSGRAVAAELTVSPTTASTRLGRLRGAGFVRSSLSGRAVLWRLNEDNEVVRAWLRERRDTRGVAAEAGSSSASTGGAGVTLERKVAADFLARLLLGDAAVGVGPGRVVVSVDFQQAPEFTVDDLVINAAAEGEDEPSLLLALAARRTPNVVDSDKKSQGLFRAYVKQLLIAPAGGPELRLGLAVGGPQEHAMQLAKLAVFAAAQQDSARFYRELRTPEKFDESVRGRLVQVEKLVRRGLVDLGLRNPTTGVVERQVWELLSQLVVMMPRMEGADETDWSALATSLMPASRGGDLYGGTLLRDRLLTLADGWAPAAASVNASMLRRASHDRLDSSVRRHREGWRALELLSQQARAAVGDAIVSADGARRVRVDRGDVTVELTAAVGSAAGVVVHGESGVGKSAATLRLLTTNTEAEAESRSDDGRGSTGETVDDGKSAGELQVVSINLRHLPATVLEFQSKLGVPLRDLLAEMSAPRRVLVVDGADAVAEGGQDLLTYLVGAAVAADVTVVAVTAADVKQLVIDTVAGQVGQGVVQVAVPPLTDAQVGVVVGEFGELAVMAANSRARELLRRPVVAALLVRGGVHGTPVSDLDAMMQVWDGLVRRGTPGRGTPDTRNVVMLQIARQVMAVGRDQVDVAATLDPIALEGLRKDGLLRTSQDNPFRPVPEFAHDEVRRYAVARLLLTDDDPTRVLVEAGVPRWALGAARLACQALLAGPDRGSNPVAGRFVRWQGRFDELVAAGYGERWMDVPGEALLTLADPRPVLREAWPWLQADGRVGVQRLTRLVDQRLRDQNNFVRVAAVEPLVELLLDDETPWRSSEAERTVLLDWLRSLVASRVPAGYALREQLRCRLIEFCGAADERLRIAEEERAAQRASITDEQRVARRSLLDFGQSGYPRSRPRRPRPEISQETTDEAVVELFALLGPDLGVGGEAMLRRVAEAAPADLAPAVEGVLCGHALAAYRQGFLADMVLAYYLDDEADGSHGYGRDEGVREHRMFGLGFPMFAWFRGPFMPLFRTDFRNGVAVLNRILNHAATARARILAGHDHHFEPAQASDIERYRTELDVTGAPRVFVGDSGTWNWYRGTGVGPYPCMSALQALERECDHVLALGLPLDLLVSMLLDGCDNVAMVGLVVGVLVRHLDKATMSLDRFLAEPEVWHFEFARVAHEIGGLRASSEGVVGADRREWSLREAAASLVLSASPERAEELRLVGQQLVDKVRRRLEHLADAVPPAAAEMELSTARGWASGLDRSTYTMQKTDGGYLIESRPPSEVTAVLSAGMSWVLRNEEAMRLTRRYHVGQQDGTAEQITPEDLIADLDSAVTLLRDPPESAMGWDAPAVVAAYALRQHLVHGLPLPDDSLKIAADIVLRVGEGEMPERDHDIEESYFSQGADRSAAYVLPLLLAPVADPVRRILDGTDGSSAYGRAEVAVTRLAHATVLQTRLFLARGLDNVWKVPCTQEVGCPHQAAMRTAIDMMRECVLGPWNMERQERAIEPLDDPVVDTLPVVAGDKIYVRRLDAAIRALGAAAVADICVSNDACGLLAVLLEAQRRALLARDRGTDDRGTHALAAARALLALNDNDAIFTHIDAYVDNSTVLFHTLRAFSAAAEESAQRADTAHRVWPSVVERLIEAHHAGHTPFKSGDYALAALLPKPSGEGTYLHSEVAGKPIIWWDPIAWQGTVDRWLEVAGGKPTCVDALVRFVASSLPIAEQARLGIPWVARAVLADSSAVASQCFSLTGWLVEVRAAAEATGVASDWQRTVDALVVAGDGRLAPYSE